MKIHIKSQFIREVSVKNKVQKIILSLYNLVLKRFHKKKKMKSIEKFIPRIRQNIELMNKIIKRGY
jgi:hypothetical protein